MQAAQILAGYSLGDADLLRRAMGKKIKSEMDAQRERFVKGCAEQSNIPAAKANELFDLIDKFAGYGFNKRSEEHTSELQSLIRISYAVFCLKKKNKNKNIPRDITSNAYNDDREQQTKAH